MPTQTLHQILNVNISYMFHNFSFDLSVNSIIADVLTAVMSNKVRATWDSSRLPP